MTLLQGPLADRDSWSAVGQCAIEKTMAFVGTKSAMLIMREAYYGTTRFDDFARWVGITKAATSARLGELVELGLLKRRPYRDPGQRSRDEYVLTEAGIDFMPVVWAMFEWGRRHLPGRHRLRLTHLAAAPMRRFKYIARKGIWCRRRSSGCAWSGLIERRQQPARRSHAPNRRPG